MIDCVLFNDELRLLQSRITYLEKYIDYFVIIEAEQTFSGKSKKLFAYENFESLKSGTSKPIVILRADFSEITTGNPWDYENQSRLQLISYVKNAFPEQRAIFCDLDEFPSVGQLENLKKAELLEDKSIYSIPTPTYYRYVNLAQIDEVNWRSACSFHASLPPDKELIRSINFIQIDGEPGAHLSYLNMQAENISSKFASFSHQELEGFEEMENGILRLADVYCVDHLGRFHNPSRGLMRFLELDQLPSTNKIILELRGGYLDAKPPRHFSRLCASALITYIRLNKAKRSATYNNLIEHMAKTSPRCLRDMGLVLVLTIFIRESFVGFWKPLNAIFKRRVLNSILDFWNTLVGLSHRH
jgi:beta-1,4-mannosyl-glycoprotein beta-1,4-N-acetylglucosaminyltransferase